MVARVAWQKFQHRLREQASWPQYRGRQDLLLVSVPPLVLRVEQLLQGESLVHVASLVQVAHQQFQQQVWEQASWPQFRSRQDLLLVQVPPLVLKVEPLLQGEPLVHVDSLVQVAHQGWQQQQEDSA